MKYLRIFTSDTSNGTGIRVVLFVAGCHHHCRHCQNAETWDFNAGKPFLGETLLNLREYLKPSVIDGITLSGGDPLAPENLPMTTVIAEEVKRMRKTVWAYTGYLYEEVKDFPIMEHIDVLVDGKFVEELRDLRLRFRGSSNQRIIDVPKSRKYGRVIERSDLY